MSAYTSVIEWNRRAVILRPKSVAYQSLAPARVVTTYSKRSASWPRPAEAVSPVASSPKRTDRVVLVDARKYRMGYQGK